MEKEALAYHIYKREPISIHEPLKQRDREVFQTVGMRVAKAEKIMKKAPQYEHLTGLTNNEWLSMDERTYDELENLALRINKGTRKTRPDSKPFRRPNLSVSAMNVDFSGLIKHIRVMQYVVEDLWDKGLKDVFPENSSIHYAKALCLKHDFYRFANINGPLPLDYVDRVSDARLNRLFPNSPAKDHLHSMEMITGTIALPRDENKLPYIYKLIDTTGKPSPRYPNVHFGENGPYTEWIVTQEKKGALPFDTVIRGRTKEERFHTVTSEEYKRRDIELTMKGLRFLQDINPAIDYNKTLEEAAGRVKRDIYVVDNFGLNYTIAA